MMKRLAADSARRLAVNALTKAGAPEEHAALQADVLLEADLRGRASHGLMRLPKLVERLRNGVINPKSVGDILRERPASIEIDGRGGFGPVIATRALDLLWGRAQAVGVAVASIRNANHLGMLSWYAERIVLHGLAGIVITTSEALVHPWGGRRALIGTNPLAIGIPLQPHSFILDMATSRVSMGQIHDYANRNEPIPAGWALDVDGEPTTVASDAKQGALSPFGGAKGYALALSIELLVTALSGAAIGTDVRGTLDSVNRCNKGDVFIVLDVQKSEEVSDYIQRYVNQISECEPIDAKNPVLIPGQRSMQVRDQSLRDGILFPDGIHESIIRLAS